MMVSNIKPINNIIEKAYKCICDGFGCSNNVKEKIDVDAGKYGTITLNLCSSCIKKFQ